MNLGPPSTSSTLADAAVPGAALGVLVVGGAYGLLLGDGLLGFIPAVLGGVAGVPAGICAGGWHLIRTRADQADPYGENAAWHRELKNGKVLIGVAVAIALFGPAALLATLYLTGVNLLPACGI